MKKIVKRKMDEMVNLISVYKNLNRSCSILNFLAMIIINLTPYRYDEKDYKPKLASEKFMEKIKDDRNLTNLVQNLALKASTKITAELLKPGRTNSPSQLKEKLMKSIANKIKEKVKKKNVLFVKLLKEAHDLHHFYEGLFKENKMFYTGEFLFKLANKKIKYPFTLNEVRNFFLKNVKINRKNHTGIIFLPYYDYYYSSSRKLRDVLVTSEVFKFSAFPEIIGIKINCHRKSRHKWYFSTSDYNIGVVLRLYPEVEVLAKRIASEEELKRLFISLTKIKTPLEKIEMKKLC